MASFVQATTNIGHIFELTPYHYVMANNEYVHAKNLKVGDIVMVGGKSMGLVKDILIDDIITDVQTVTRKGLYNPYTVAGDILVFAPASNQTLGVVASVHSDWFLEDYVKAARVPDIYQALLAPVRTIHSGSFTAYVFATDCARALALCRSFASCLTPIFTLPCLQCMCLPRIVRALALSCSFALCLTPMFPLPRSFSLSLFISHASVHPKWNERFTAHFKNSTEPLDQHGFYKIVSVMAATF